ncbi:PREDICTED: uncharacterized protein LOC109217953 [Nicotiana attenuata]|uniref:uncharacterized protein LOC109217953 n=1 Tax=Nicotiana attenuata TaxID=49451 RepID=UPI000904B9B7|nr:PREDICTED: uncharacterized protein LOC109217953 [Nicotiana attenuata]
MDEAISNNYKESLLQDQSSSRTKRKLRLIICLVTLFTLIIAAIISASVILKQKTESKSLSFNPTNAITAVCELISEDPDSCFDSIASLYDAQIPLLSSWSNGDSRINPSRIFVLSLYASRIELENVASSIEKIISVSPKTVGVLRNCQGMIRFSLKQLNESVVSLGVDPDEKILAINKVVWDLQLWIGEAQGQVQRCVDLLEDIPSTVAVNINAAQQNMRNSRGILGKVDDIFDLFYPRIGTALGSLILEFEYGLTVWLFCSAYLLLGLPACLLPITRDEDIILLSTFSWRAETGVGMYLEEALERISKGGDSSSLENHDIPDLASSELQSV